MAGTITRYVYDGEDILLEYDGTNTFVARYSHGDQVDQPLVLQKAGQGFFYYHSNHQGSITHLTDSGGSIANSYIYDSYGRRLTVAESVIQPFSYTGREYDAESGLYFYRARYFDANTGRFLSEDPIGFDAGDQNLYRYVLNNPVNFTDPNGEVAFVIPLGIGLLDLAGFGVGFTLGLATINEAQNALQSSVPSTFERSRGRGKQRKRGDDLKDLSDEELFDRARDRSKSKAERARAKEEEKARKKRRSRQSKDECK